MRTALRASVRTKDTPEIQSGGSEPADRLSIGSIHEFNNSDLVFSSFELAFPGSGEAESFKIFSKNDRPIFRQRSKPLVFIKMLLKSFCRELRS